RTRKLFPLLCAAASHGVGSSDILDFIVDYCPSPAQAQPVFGTTAHNGSQDSVEIKCNSNAQPVMFVYKTVSEPHVGELSFFRVYSGSIKPGLDLLNDSNNKPERLAQIFVMNGKERREVIALHAGDMGAVVKLKDTHTNNTLSSKSFPVL